MEMGVFGCGASAGGVPGASASGGLVHLQAGFLVHLHVGDLVVHMSFSAGSSIQKPLRH